MTDQQRMFVNAYFECNFNASKAAAKAGYSQPYQQAWEVKTSPEVAAEIERRMAEFAMPANEVLARIGNQARATIADVFEIQGKYPVFSPAKAFETGAIDNIKAITKTPDGGVRVEMYDAQAALVHLGRHHKLFTDKTENNNPEALEMLREMIGVSPKVEPVNHLDNLSHGDTEGTAVSTEALELDAP